MLTACLVPADAVEPGPAPVALGKAKACADNTWKDLLYVAAGHPVTFDAVGPNAGGDCRDDWSHDLDYQGDPNEVCDTIDFQWSTAGLGVISTASTFSYTFSEPGDVTVNLRVTDTPGNNNDNDPNPPYGKKAGEDTVSVKVRTLGGPIETPDGTDLILHCPYTDSPTYRFRRKAGQPSEPTPPTYEWSVTAGSDKVEVVGSSTEWEVKLRPTSKSIVKGDVTLQLKYTWQTCEEVATVNLTVRKPSTSNSSAVPGDLIIDDVLGPWGDAEWVWGKFLTFTVLDQFNDPVPGVLWDETCWVTSGACSTPEQGDRHTGADVVIEDEHSITTIWAPSGAHTLICKVRQKVVVAGCTKEGEDHFWLDDTSHYEDPDTVIVFP